MLVSRKLGSPGDSASPGRNLDAVSAGKSPRQEHLRFTRSPVSSASGMKQLLLLKVLRLLIYLVFDILEYAMFTANWTQALTYLFGVCLFSISFLVFVNSEASFVVTDLIRQDRGVGNVVGTLGFADELVALIACPLWGVASDRIGVRTVSNLALQHLQLSFIQNFQRTFSFLKPRCHCQAGYQER